MTACPDLRRIAGNRYRLAHDHRDSARATDDPWLLTIPCRYGHVYPHGPGRLAFASRIRGGVARAVAAIVKPRKRRQVSPEQRQAAAERLAAYKFPARQSDKSPQIPAQTA